MAEHYLDAKGLRCPRPTLKVSCLMHTFESGDILTVDGDCPTFVDDLKKWATRMGKTILAVRERTDFQTVQIQF